MINVDKFVYSDGDVLEFIVLKHGTHNQSTHGNWASGGEGQKVTSLIDELYEKKTPGFSINIKSRRTPKTGFMCSEQGFEKRIKATDFYSSRDVARKYLVEYMQKNAEPLSKKGAYFGAWVEKGKVYLDVSRRYESRQKGVDAGVSNEQKAIYDVSNDSFIYIGDESGQTNKAVVNRSSETSQSDDGRGIVRIRRRDFERDGQLEDDDFNPLEEFTLTVHTANGRSLGIKPGEFVTQKHQLHDQSTHGSWASFSGDSSLLARNGAIEFAEQNNIKQNKSISYKDVVANRARASKIANAYDELPDFDKEAVDEFQSLGDEVNNQFSFMTKKLGVKVEFVSTDPYKTSKEMFADVSKKRLKVLSSKATGGHPVFTDEQNDRFRAVHDFFGHAATGRGFGQDGEEAAWVHHSQMFTPKARLALTTETRGQNSWYNTRKNGFAKQKIALLPDEFVLVPETFEKHSTHDQSSHAGNRGRGNNNPNSEEEVTDPNAPKPELKPGRKPDASGSLEERANKLANGERIQVTKSEAKKIMKIMARREDDPDLTNMHIENTLLYDEDNLNIPRNKMPQVPSDTKAVFIAEMEKRGTRIQRGVADPAKLHPIQKEMSASKVGLIMKRLRDKGMKTGDDGRIVISKDNYVIDGHHRWAAAAMLSFEDSSVKIPVIRVDMNHKDLISATLAWNKASGIQPIGLGEENPNSTFKKWAEFDAIVAKAVRGRTVIRFQPGLKPVMKHQDHDQSSHGNWAKGGSPTSAGVPTNIDANKSSGTYTDEDGDSISLWDNLSWSGAEDNPRLEQLCGLAFENINRGEKMMSVKECLDYTDKVLMKYGYGDRLVASSIDSPEVFGGNRSGVEAAISRGMTELMPEGNSLRGKDIPVLCLRKRGTTKPALLHEIAHIMEGSWIDPSEKARGGHNEVWYETWHTLLQKEGLNKSANYLSFIVYKPEGTGVLNVG